MKAIRKSVWLFSGLSILLASGWVVAADIPSDKEALTLSDLGGKQGPVAFQHQKHVKEFKKKGAAAIVCNDCHHKLQGDKVVGCKECHAKPGEAEKTIDGKKALALATVKDGKAEMKSVLYHKTCIDGCHKEMKAEGKNITGCKTCHKK